MRAPPDSPFARFPWSTRERRAWKHTVFAGNPPLAAVSQEARHSFFNRRCTNDARVPNFNQSRSLGHSDVIRRNSYGAHLLRSAIVTAKGRHARSLFNHGGQRDRVIG